MQSAPDPGCALERVLDGGNVKVATVQNFGRAESDEWDNFRTSSPSFYGQLLLTDTVTVKYRFRVNAFTSWSLLRMNTRAL